MEPRKHTLAELFEGQLIYVVPTYQRLYVWNLEDQWQPLWADVEELANKLIRDSATRDFKDINPESTDPHFLGAVVLKMSGSTPDLARQLRVIDGQQRLTTLQLLLVAAVSELEQADLPVSDRLRELTENSSRSTTQAHANFKINHHRHRRGHDYERFGDVITAGLSGSSSEPIEGPMAECFRFFQGAIKNYLNKNKNHRDIAASALATTLIMKLDLVGIYLDAQEREHIIFETLNARGEPLTEWDKIKNYLLYKADQESDLDQESFFYAYLDRFDEPWWRQAVGRGFQRPRTDIFADYWLESKKKTPVAVRRVFREFEKYVNEDDKRVEPVMQGFINDSKYYQRFEEPDANNQSREGLFHSRRLELAIGAIWPLLLRLQRIDSEDSRRDRRFEILESYVVRRLIVGCQARSYDQVTLELMTALPKANDIGHKIEEEISDHLLKYTEAGSIWPSDAELEQAVLNRRLPKYAQRLVLSAIERHLIPNWAGNQYVAPNLHVEHIMPQSWSLENWPLPASDDQSHATEERAKAIETLGNLTLLNGRLNSSISNASWTTKRPAIQKSDNLFLNRRLLEEAEADWTECDIRKRAKWMYDLIVEIWPRG